MLPRDSPVKKFDDSLGACGDIPIVCHYDQGLTLLVETDEDFQDLGSTFRVKIACRFISQNNQRVICQRPGNCHSLLLTATQFRGSVLDSFTQAYHLGQFPGTFGPLEPRPALVIHRDLYVLDYIELVNQIE